MRSFWCENRRWARGLRDVRQCCVFFFFFYGVCNKKNKIDCRGMDICNGRIKTVPLDRGGRCGHFGVKIVAGRGFWEMWGSVILVF
jgi:hypothetical protein